MLRKIELLVLILCGFIFTTTSGIASSKTFPTGIQYVNESTCLKHNVVRHCYLNNLYPSYKEKSCYEGTAKRNKTESTIIKCQTQTSLDKRKLKKCQKIHRKFMNADEVCTISQALWDAYEDCYGVDIQKQRRTQCPKGCEDVPAYHVCDWTDKEYQFYKHCSSIKYLAQQTRENVCPSGMSDVGKTGPPIRINIIGDRKPHQKNYLTFDQNFILEFSSITGKKEPKYCITKGSEDECTFKPFRKTNQVEKAKYVIPSEGMSPGTYKLIAKNGNGKKSFINFVILPSEKENTAQLIKKGRWIELIGPDLSPVIPPNNNPSSYYLANNCEVLYQEVKDISGKRWKCMEPQYGSDNYNYAGSNGFSSNQSCQIYERCNSFGVRFNIQICSQGAVPAQTKNIKWEPFVFPGQYIHYPEAAGKCDPNDKKYQTIDPSQGSSV